MPLRLALAVLVGLAAWPAAPSAQVVGRVEGRQATPNSGYYVNAIPGEPTTRVFVWGSVRYPGVYEVGEGFDLQSVLSLAGLPVESDQEPGDPEVRVAVYRPGADGPVYEASLAAFVAAPEAHPPLAEGDVMTVGFEPDARVNVVGDVRTPGLYEVGPGFDPAAVLSLAGGPQLPPLVDNDERDVAVRYLRAGRELFAGDLDGFYQASATLPVPASGDVIAVDVRTRRGFTFRDAFPIVSALAGIGSVVAIIATR